MFQPHTHTHTHAHKHTHTHAHKKAMVWQELLLATVGEQFSDSVADSDDVCGVSVRIRGFDQNVIQIWNQDSELHSKSSVSNVCVVYPK